MTCCSFARRLLVALVAAATALPLCLSPPSPDARRDALWRPIAEIERSADHDGKRLPPQCLQWPDSTRAFAVNNDQLVNAQTEQRL